jgi:hypothetical protein
MLKTRTIRAGVVLPAAVLVTVAVVLVIVLTGGGKKQPAVPVQPGPVPSSETRLFSPTSPWNAPVPANAPLDPSSSQLVAALSATVTAEEQTGRAPWIATSTASTPIYIVPAGQPAVAVQLDDPTLPWRRTLAAAFQHVPIPADARPARGRDAHMTVYQPSTDRLWEFFHARHEADGWHAAWGGAMEHVSKSPGYYSTASWPGAQINWGATATSLPVAAGVITLAEIRAGAIDHALALDLPHPRAGVVSWPAEQGDGTGDATTIPEGAHLVLDPKLDLSRISMPPLTRMIAVAAQRYGLIVRDGAPGGISLFAEDPGQYGGRKLYWGKHAIFGGLTPQKLLASFPWSHLEVLKMELRSVRRSTKFLESSG